MSSSGVSADPRVGLLQELGDPIRLGVLERLAAGPATATELAGQVGASPTALANHLRRLRDARLVEVERRGRHAVYSLAEPGLQDLLSLLNGLRPQPARNSAAQTPTRPLAARCYDHLAGELGVAFFDTLVAEGALVAREGEGEVTLGPKAEVALGRLGLRPPLGPSRRIPAYACRDATVGRPHLGGILGADLLRVLIERAWIEPAAGERALAVTPAGRRGLRRLLGQSSPL
jgi:DNA-binding transcriptional ArsR family regulator